MRDGIHERKQTMQIVVVFAAKEHKTLPELSERRKVRVRMHNAPSSIAIGDVIFLEKILSTFGSTVTRREWHGNELVIKCEVFAMDLIMLLIRDAVAVENTPHMYELPAQEWR